MRYRLVLIAALFVALTVACNSDDDLPKSSAHPELSVQDILDRIPENATDPQTARITTVRESDGLAGKGSDKSLGIFVGGDFFSESDDLQQLFFDGEYYTRESSSDPWKKDPELSDSLERYKGLRDSFLADIDTPSPDDANSRRLPDGYIDDEQVLHLAFDISLTSNDVEAYNQYVRDAVASFGHDTTDLPRVARMEGTYELWLDAETFEHRGVETAFRAWAADGELLLSSKKTTTVTDINEPLSLPGPLPSPAR